MSGLVSRGPADPGKWRRRGGEGRSPVQAGRPGPDPSVGVGAGEAGGGLGAVSRRETLEGPEPGGRARPGAAEVDQCVAKVLGVSVGGVEQPGEERVAGAGLQFHGPVQNLVAARWVASGDPGGRPAPQRRGDRPLEVHGDAGWGISVLNGDGAIPDPGLRHRPAIPVRPEEPVGELVESGVGEQAALLDGGDQWRGDSPPALVGTEQAGSLDRSIRAVAVEPSPGAHGVSRIGERPEVGVENQPSPQLVRGGGREDGHHVLRHRRDHRARTVPPSTLARADHREPAAQGALSSPPIDAPRSAAPPTELGRLHVVTRKTRHAKGGRVTPKGTRPRDFRPRHEDRRPEPAAGDLMADVRRALGDDHPLGLLAFASSLLAVVDPRRVSAMERDRLAGPSREELVGSFLEVEQVETSALLAAIGMLGGDEVERRRIARTLERRAHPLPAWLAAAERAEATGAVMMTHLLRDGDNLMIGARLPSGDELTAVVYIDHNLGTLVKDAFVVPQPLHDLVAYTKRKNTDPDTTWSDVDPADAKFRILDAVATGAMTFPPFETDTWPVCRPLVEWMTSLLPDGGTGYDRPEWSGDDRRALTDRFFASPFAAGLDDPDHRSLFDSLLWFGCDYGPGDPLRWSPPAVEILLLDWIPRKIVADADYLADAPDLLRAFVRFAHAERSVPAHLTDQTLGAVDSFEPEYQTLIRSDRPQGPAALLAALGVLDPDRPWEDPAPWEAKLADARAGLLECLRRAVGGDDALAALDDAPLPDEPFDWTGIDDDIRPKVAEILDLCDQHCTDLLDTEYRTAARRVLARIARQGPDAFRRRGRADTAAAAICWAVGRVNDLFIPGAAA